MIKIIQTLDRTILRLFANMITESSIAVEEIRTLTPVEKIRILAPLDEKKLYILSGEHSFFDRWIYELNENHLYVDNISCYKYLSNKFVPLLRYTLFTIDYPLECYNQYKDLKKFIKTTYPFDIISTRELTDINKIEKELDTYCLIYVPKGDLPEIEEIEKQTQFITEFIENGLWNEVYSSIYHLSNGISTIIPQEMIERLEYQRLEYPDFYGYSERMGHEIGEANYLILLIDIFKNEGYHIKDYILEGIELVINLKDGVEIKLDEIFGIKTDKKDLRQIENKYDVMKKFIEETFPLNKIAMEEIDPGHGKIILKDFLKGIKIIPQPYMFKKIIHHLDLETLKLLIKEVLKENKNAKIYINLTKENIESILETDQLIPRLYIKDTSKDANRYIVETINFNITITDNFDILLILNSPTCTLISIATKRLLLDSDIEIYKDTLRDVIITNPNAIIGDIIFKDIEDLRDIVDNIPTDIPKGISYMFQLDILQKDQETIRELYKTVDITKFKEDAPILRATIDGIEISETFTPETFIASATRKNVVILGGKEKYYRENENYNRFLTFHMGKINKI